MTAATPRHELTGDIEATIRGLAYWLDVAVTYVSSANPHRETMRDMVRLAMAVLDGQALPAAMDAMEEARKCPLVAVAPRPEPSQPPPALTHGESRLQEVSVPGVPSRPKCCAGKVGCPGAMMYVGPGILGCSRCRGRIPERPEPSQPPTWDTIGLLGALAGLEGYLSTGTEGRVREDALRRVAEIRRLTGIDALLASPAPAAPRTEAPNATEAQGPGRCAKSAVAQSEPPSAVPLGGAGEIDEASAEAAPRPHGGDPIGRLKAAAFDVGSHNGGPGYAEACREMDAAEEECRAAAPEASAGEIERLVRELSDAAYGHGASRYAHPGQWNEEQERKRRDAARVALLAAVERLTLALTGATKEMLYQAQRAERLTRERADAEASINVWMAAANAAEAACERAESEVERRTAERDEYRRRWLVVIGANAEKLAEVRAALAAAEAEVERLREKRDVARAFIDSLHAMLADQQKRAELAEAALSAARRRIEALRGAIERIGDGMLRAAWCSDDPADMLRAYANDLGAALQAPPLTESERGRQS